MRVGTLVFTLLLIMPTISGCITDIIDSGFENDQVTGPDTELVIVTYDVSGLTDSMLAEFENQTGFEVTLIKLGDAGSILDHLLQHKGAQSADLALGLDNTYLQTAIDAGVLVEHLAQVENLSDSALEPYDGPLAVPFDQGWICLNYDTDKVDGENLTIPISLWDLTQEEWRGRVVVPSPATSSPGRAFMTTTTDYFSNDGDNSTEWTDWWSAMSDNELIITSGWSEAYETHYTGGYGEWTDGHIGDAYLTVSYCHSPGVEAYFGGNWTHSAALDLDGASFHQVEYVAAIDGGNLIAASAFIEYLTSESVNANMPIENYMYPALDGMDLPEADGYRYHSIVPTTSADVSMSTIAVEMDDWISDWNAAVL